MSSDRAADRWATLRRGGHESSALEIPSLDTGISTGYGTVRLALGGKGEARLLLPIRQSEKLNLEAGSQSIHIGSQNYQLNGSTTRYLDVMCLASALEGVFTEVADEIILRIEMGHSAQEACSTTIGDFRQLLAPPTVMIDTQTVTGLVGELLLLNRLLLLSPFAWKLWRGPLMERHDFRGGSDALEVKTTSRVSSSSVMISALDQLLEPEGGRLHLVLYNLEAATGASLSVSGLAQQAIAVASEPMEVRNLLANMGCVDPGLDIWNSQRFELAGERHYEVKDGFPRIVPSTFGGSVPPGIERVLYELDLSAASSFECDQQLAEAYLREMVLWLDR